MRRLMLLLLPLLCLCASCTALPAEERAFAVVLCVEKEGASWQAHARIPTYQTGGGYLTVSGKGETLPGALAAMEAATPMRLQLSQLRLLALSQSLGTAGEVSAVLTTLSDGMALRPQCQVAMTEVPGKKLMEALKPTAGARLSKSLDVLLDSRMEQGLILSASVSDLLRMGERQTPVLMKLALEDGAVSLAGGVPLTQAGTASLALTQEETALLSLLRGDADSLQLMLPEGSAQVRDASVKISISDDLRQAEVTLTLHSLAASLTPKGLEAALAKRCILLLGRLSEAGCDVLGLGRKAVLQAHDMADWHALNWPEIYRKLRWTVSVRASGTA